jgi:integrase
MMTQQEMTLYNKPDTTKSDSTCADYLEKTQQLFNRYSKSVSEGASLKGFSLWLVSLRPQIKASTWQSYKSSVVYFYETKGEVELANELKKVGSDLCKSSAPSKNNPLNTSSKKKKFISESEERKVTAFLNNETESSYWAKPTLAVFKAILITGLRPSELQNSILIESDSDNYTPLALPVLKVKNGKSTNGRSHGEYRHLGLSATSKKDLIFLKIALSYADKSSKNGLLSPSGKESDWESYYKKLRGNFYRVINKVFHHSKKSITFYSCRHQFIADLKANGYSLVEIAAITGHATDETASAHYGRRKHGSKKQSLPQALDTEIAKVIEVYSAHPSQTKEVSQKPNEK